MQNDTFFADVEKNAAEKMLLFL